jgi:hypothetical protein
VHGLVEARPGTTAELLGSERGDVDEKETVRDERGGFDGFRGLDFLWLRRLNFHNALGYWNLRRQHKTRR